MNSLPRNHSGSQPPDTRALLAEILNVLSEIRELLEGNAQHQAREADRRDEYRAAFLNSRFPYGKPTDRWRRG